MIILALKAAACFAAGVLVTLEYLRRSPTAAAALAAKAAALEAKIRAKI